MAADKEALMAEERKLRRLCRAMDLAAALLWRVDLTLDEARDVVNHAKRTALELFPELERRWTAQARSLSGWTSFRCTTSVPMGPLHGFDRPSRMARPAALPARVLRTDAIPREGSIAARAQSRRGHWRGSHREKVEPAPTTLCTSIRPPSAADARAHRCSPNPTPPTLRLLQNSLKPPMRSRNK